MLQAGDHIPHVTVWAGTREPVTLQKLAEEGPLLLFFYLFDWSSTWTHELELLRDRGAELTKAGVRRFGISRDSPWTHIAWAQVLDIDFQLLSDFNGDATHGFGVAFDYRGLRDVSERTAFLIDQGGTVRGAWRYESSEVPDVDVLLSAARALQD